VTPEAAWPDDPGPPASHRRRQLEQAFADVEVPVVLGVSFSDPATTSLVVLDHGRIVDRFDKQDRVPLTEAPALGLRASDPIRPGDGPRRLRLPDLPIAPLICIEDLSMGARHAAAAAPLALLTANDAWTDHTSGTTWHLAWARLAAATLGTPTVRVSNTGPSGIGPRFDALPAGRPGVAIVSVSPGRHGLPRRHPLVDALLAAGLVIIGGRRPRHAPGGSRSPPPASRGSSGRTHRSPSGPIPAAGRAGPAPPRAQRGDGSPAARPP